MNDAHENALVHQKNAILDVINAGDYDKATLLINFAEELWAANSYAYKTRELRNRVREAIWHNVVHSTHHKTEAKWRRLYEALPSGA